VSYFSFNLPTRVTFGPGAIESLARQAALYGRRALVVTGKSSLAGSGHRDQILASLQEQGLEIEIMSGVNPEPGLEEVGEGIRRLKECRAQLVIGIGGGSTIDVGKAVAALAGQSRPPEDYFYGREPEQRGCPFLAVPTTSGSGSEVTPNSVLTHEGKKQSVRGPYMWPVAAVVDPELTVSMPPAVTAHSGFDALTHAVEAYTSRGANPLTDLYALEAVKRIMAGLPETFKNGEHRPARESMSLAALLAGVALANARLGAVHGLAHAVGVASGKPHGLVCAVLLPHVMAFNMKTSRDRYASLRAAVAPRGEGGAGAAEKFIEQVIALQQELRLPRRLRDLGVKPEHFEAIVEQSLPSSSLKHNPREAGARELQQLLEQAW